MRRSKTVFIREYLKQPVVCEVVGIDRPVLPG